jgi:hypothetical protein
MPEKPTDDVSIGKGLLLLGLAFWETRRVEQTRIDSRKIIGCPSPRSITFATLT